MKISEKNLRSLRKFSKIKKLLKILALTMKNMSAYGIKLRHRVSINIKYIALDSLAFIVTNYTLSLSNLVC